MVRYAENTHRVLTTVEMVGGVTVLLKTGATLLAKEGFKACAKLAAKEIAQETASAVAAELSLHAAELVGLSDEQVAYVRIGVDAYQTFAFLKAARAQVDPNAACFTAGTQAVTGLFDDGTFATSRIEDLSVGDLVLARDQHDAADDLDLRRVTNVFTKTSDHVRHLSVQGDGDNVGRKRGQVPLVGNGVRYRWSETGSGTVDSPRWVR